jgi:DNA-binding NarL/FixJ family response regulator
VENNSCRSFEARNGKERRPGARIIEEIVQEKSGKAEESSITELLSNYRKKVTPRQLQVLQLLMEGKMRVEIARELKISPGRVSQIVGNLRKRV